MRRFFASPFGILLLALQAATLLPSTHGAGSALAAESAVREYLDETTAATVTVTESWFVFARDRTDLAVNARDYVSLAPIEINRAGQRAYFWSGYVWSTIDRRDRTPVVDPEATLVLLVHGRPIRLSRDARPFRDLGISRPPTPAPIGGATAVLFPTDPEVLAFVSTASDLRVLVVRDGSSEEFELWKDGRGPLRSFLRHLKLDRP